MSYGHPGWQSWVLGDKEGIEHMKFAYVQQALFPIVRHSRLTCRHEHGITTFVTADVSLRSPLAPSYYHTDTV